MPLPTTLEAYAVRRINKLEKKVEEKDNLITALNEKYLKAMAILEAMNPHMSSNGDYVTFGSCYPDRGSQLFGYLVDLGLLPVEGPANEGEM